MAMEPDEDMPVEKMQASEKLAAPEMQKSRISVSKTESFENKSFLLPEDKSQPYEKAIWWAILAIALLLIILLYSCKVAVV
jgi:hypothetical protein